MKYRYARFLMLIVFVALPVFVCQAASSSENERLLCALTEVIECDDLGKCIELSAYDAGLPDFLVIDLTAKKLLEATSISLRETRFDARSSVEGITILSGVDGVRGWSAVLSKSNTRLTASVSDESAGFLLFGACRAD